MFTGASVKVIQLLQHFEQLSSVFAQAVSVWSTDYGVRAIVGEIIRFVCITYTIGSKVKKKVRFMIERFFNVIV